VNGPWPEPLPAVDPYDDLPSTGDGERAVLSSWIQTALRGGAGRWGEIQQLAERLGLFAAPRHDPRLPEVATAVASTSCLLRIATDIAPASGNDGPDRFLGPRVDELDVRVPGHRALLVLATAACCFLVPDDDEKTPLHRWSRQPPAPSVSDRAAVRAIARAPVGVWTLTGGPRSFSVRDGIGIAPAWVPDAPVDVGEAVLWSGPARAGDTLVARMVRTVEGFRACLGLVLPCPPRRRGPGWWTSSCCV
jgi:hypothetical protein